MSKSEVKPFKVRQSILYSGGNKPEGSPDFYTMEVIEYSAYQALQKENEELKTALSEIKGYRWCPSCHNEVSRLIATEALKKD